MHYPTPQRNDRATVTAWTSDHHAHRAEDLAAERERRRVARLHHRHAARIRKASPRPTH